MTLEQFRSWLSGVEDMQADDWVPSGIQWKKIRAKIDEIETPIPQQSVPTYPSGVRSGQLQPLMEPAPSMIPLFDPINQQFTTPPQMRFEPDVVNPPVNQPGNPSPKVDGTYRSGFV